jgi:ABC-type uncharacterized transport system auxiliary subunit
MAFVYGCGTTPSPRYYRVPLDASALVDTSLRTYKESLRVDRFHAISPLRQDSIVTYRGESALVDFSSNDLWESAPPDMVSRKLAEAFRTSRLFSRIDEGPGGQPADYLIRGRILRFNRFETNNGLYGDVGLEVEFVSLENRQILWSALIKNRQRAEAEDPEAAIQAVSVALGQCIVQIIQQVKQTTASYQLSH